MYNSLTNNSTKDILTPTNLPIEAWAFLHKQILLHLYQQQQQIVSDAPLDLTIPKKIQLKMNQIVVKLYQMMKRMNNTNNNSIVYMEMDIMNVNSVQNNFLVQQI